MCSKKTFKSNKLKKIIEYNSIKNFIFYIMANFVEKLKKLKKITAKLNIKLNNITKKTIKFVF